MNMPQYCTLQRQYDGGDFSCEGTTFSNSVSTLVVVVVALVVIVITIIIDKYQAAGKVPRAAQRDSM
jgi:hypothetical protein